MEDYNARSRNSRGIREIFRQHLWDWIVYFSIAVLIFFVYHFLSDGDFSFLMTLGSMLNVLSFGMLVAKVARDHNTSAISMKTLQCYALVFAGRLCSILVYEGYLPYDKSGDWLYQTCETTTLIIVIGLLLAHYVVYPRRENRVDAFGDKYVPQGTGAVLLIIPAFIIAAIFHPSLNNNWFTDTAWAFALYLEAVCMFPQLTMFHRSKEKEVEFFTGNFVFGVAAARVLHFVFWLSSYHELNNKYAEQFHHRYPGLLVVLFQIINLLLLGDYMWAFLNAARERKALLPHTMTQTV